MAARKPKGRYDDLYKLFIKAQKAGNKRLADQLKREMDMVSRDAVTKARGLKALEKKWNKRLAAYDYTAEEAVKGKTRGARKRAQSKLRGMDRNFRSAGKKESSNMTRTLEEYSARAEKSAEKRAAGGRNAPAEQTKRQQQMRARRERIRKEIEQGKRGGKGKGNGGAAGSAAKRPKRPKNPRGGRPMAGAARLK